MLKANYHTHVKLCGHAEGMSMDYVEKAIELGMIELGISDHNPVPKRFMNEEEYRHNMLYELMSEEELINVYIPDVNEAKKNGKVKILLGLEAEYNSNEHAYFEYLRSKVDYLILGMHFVFIDGKVYSCYDEMREKEIIAYTDEVIKGMETGMYTCLVHPDLFMLSYYSKEGFRVFDEVCKECSLRIINSAIKNDVYLEINANGMRHGSCIVNGVKEYYYPRSEFWRLVSGTEAKVIIGCDAHKTSALGDEFVLEAKDFANRLGVKVLDFMQIKK